MNICSRKRVNIFQFGYLKGTELFCVYNMTFYIFSVSEQVTGIKLNPRSFSSSSYYVQTRLRKMSIGKAQLRKTYVSNLVRTTYF